MTVDKIDIQEGRESSYRRLVRPRMMDELKKGILRQIAVKRKYRNPKIFIFKNYEFYIF